MKLRVKRIIFIAVLCVLGAIALVRSPMRFQTNLTSLLNIENVDGWPIQTITENFSSVVNIVIQSEDRFAGDMAVKKIQDVLNSDEFLEFEPVVNNFSPREFVSIFGKYHNVMIGVADRKLLGSGQFSDISRNAQLKIESSVVPNMLPLEQDPFLLFTNYLFEISNNGNWIPQNGALWQYRAPYNFYMLPVRVVARDSGQLANSIIKLKSEVGKIDNVQIYMGGAPVHTAEMYSRSKVELGIISILAIIAVIVMNYMLFRRIGTMLPIITSLAVGYLSGTIALFLGFVEPHILVFVFGTSLIGLGIDYAFHFINIGNDKDRMLVRKNVWNSFLTTVICFVPLLFSSISLLRQIAVFTIAGLGAIYVFINLFVSCRANSTKQKFVHPLNKKYRIWVMTIFVVIMAFACCFARFENNMSALYKPTEKLAVAERIIGELNKSNKTGLLVVRGGDIQQVLETEEAVRDSGVNFFGVSSIIPSHTRQLENQDLIRKLYASQAKNIRQALGLKKIPQFIDDGLISLDDNDLDGLVKNFIFENDGLVYSVSSVPADKAISNDNARIIVPAQQIQTQMATYSHEVYRLLGICGLILIGALLFLYRGQAFKYLVPPLLGVGATIGVLAVLGMPITFFHLLGFFIVVGLGLDYAIFHINSGAGGEMWPVFYSFLTSFIGFGLLAFTGFSIISALGITLALGIAVSYIVSLYLFRD